MSIDGFNIKNIVGSNAIKDDFNNLNLNDNGLYNVLYEHIKGLSDKHNISDIENDSSVDGSNIKEVLEFIYNTFLNHTTGTSNRHNTSNIDNDSEIIANTLNEVLELLKLNTDNHIASVVAHTALAIIFDNTNTSEITATDVQNAIEQLNSRVSNIIVEGGDSNPEIVDARNSVFWDIVFTTLKERLDYTESKFGELYPQNDLGITVNHNLGKYPQVDMLSTTGAFGIGGYGDLPYGGGGTQTESVKILHNDRNSFNVVVPNQLNLSNPTVNEIVESEEYAIVFDNTNTSLNLILI